MQDPEYCKLRGLACSSPQQGTFYASKEADRVQAWSENPDNGCKVKFMDVTGSCHLEIGGFQERQ
eukprot:186266-Chlamydomonas_euryale.AAC.1